MLGLNADVNKINEDGQTTVEQEKEDVRLEENLEKGQNADQSCHLSLTDREADLGQTETRPDIQATMPPESSIFEGTNVTQQTSEKDAVIHQEAAKPASDTQNNLKPQHGQAGTSLASTTSQKPLISKPKLPLSTIKPCQVKISVPTAGATQVKKKFDVKESLKRPLTYKPHTGTV